MQAPSNTQTTQHVCCRTHATTMHAGTLEELNFAPMGQGLAGGMNMLTLAGSTDFPDLQVGPATVNLSSRISCAVTTVVMTCCQPCCTAVLIATTMFADYDIAHALQTPRQPSLDGLQLSTTMTRSCGCMVISVCAMAHVLGCCGNETSQHTGIRVLTCTDTLVCICWSILASLLSCVLCCGSCIGSCWTVHMLCMLHRAPSPQHSHPFHGEAPLQLAANP